MSTDTPMIAVKGLVKQYGFIPVLRGLNLTLNAGDSLALLGPNGAGKTTLLRILATLSPPTQGTVTIGGWPLPTHADRVRRHIGLVSHQPLLYGDLSAAENLLFFARLYQLDNADDRINQALKMVGLAARQRDPVRSFSRGMLQRLTIARATLHQPDVLLLDEPYTGLDQDGVHLLDDLLQQEIDKGRTLLMITHNLNQAYLLCRQLAILHRGQINQIIDSQTISATELVTQYHQLTRSKKKSKPK
ncbi:MAG TPA: heme ABC exporter ATP-binding protein CcmA [Anaerolineae bacterium]|nr:heme ABC exporter ATP-binding protein CcmA [Anaerolineae bacterium]